MTKPNRTAEPFDIGTLDTIEASDKGAEIELLHPTTQEPLGVFITVLGKHSQIFRDNIKDTINARIRRESVAAHRNKMVPPETAEAVEARAIELLVLCTISWRSVVKDAKGKITSETPTLTYKGEELPYSVQNAITVYTGSLWIREQVDAGIGDLENFIRA